MSADEVFEVEVLEGPRKVGGGRFSIYLTDEEKIVVALLHDGAEESETQRFVLPPLMVRLVARQFGVNPAEMLRRIGSPD